MRTKAQIESEIAVFWDEIAQNLPKSIEMSALGHEKIFRAFKIAYPKIRAHLISVPLSILEDLRKEVEGKIQDIDDPERIFDHETYEEFFYKNKAFEETLALLDEQITALK